MKERVALEVGDNEKIDVATAMHRTFGIGAKKHDAFRGEGADQAGYPLARE